MSKGIAINTILYLLLGILVVGILVYLVYTYTTSPGLDINNCRSIVTNWCNSCMIAGWPAGFSQKTSTDKEYKCISSYFSAGTLKAIIDCNTTYGVVGDTKTNTCKQFTG